MAESKSRPETNWNVVEEAEANSSLEEAHEYHRVDVVLF